MSYDDDLIMAAIEKREEIENKLKRFGEMIDSGVIEKFEETTSLFKIDNFGVYAPSKVAAIDGGSYVVPFLGFDIYFIKSYAVKMNWDKSLNKPMEKSLWKVVDIDLMIPPVQTQDRVTLYRQITELRATLNSLREGYLTLGDGSVESMITRPTHIKPELLDSWSKYTCKDIEDILNDYKDQQRNMAVLVKRIVENVYSQDADTAKRLELAEKVFLFSQVLKEIESGKTLVYVTKTGRSNSIFNSMLPDQYIISQVTKKAGYILEREEPVSLKDVMESGMTDFCGTRELSGRVALISGFARLKDMEPVLKIQVLVSKKLVNSMEDIKRIYETKLLELGSISINGYPIPLQLAHQYAHITTSSTKIVIDGLRLKEQLTGREEIDVL